MGCKMPWWAGSETPPPDKDKVIAELRALTQQQAEQIAELKRDAERYRALRDMPGNGDELDADIDTLILDATKGEA